MALAADRDTRRRDGREFSRDVAAATVIYAGALVCLNAAGNAVPGSTATTLVADGRAAARADNGSGSIGDVKVLVEKGVFRFDNSASSDLITKAEIGDTCYVVDDHTVAKTDGSSARSAAGTVVDVDALGVWVRFD